MLQVNLDIKTGEFQQEKHKWTHNYGKTLAQTRHFCGDTRIWPNGNAWMTFDLPFKTNYHITKRWSSAQSTTRRPETDKDNITGHISDVDQWIGRRLSWYWHFARSYPWPLPFYLDLDRELELEEREEEREEPEWLPFFLATLSASSSLASKSYFDKSPSSSSSSSSWKRSSRDAASWFVWIWINYYDTRPTYVQFVFGNITILFVIFFILLFFVIFFYYFLFCFFWGRRAAGFPTKLFLFPTKLRQWKNSYNKIPNKVRRSNTSAEAFKSKIPHWSLPHRIHHPIPLVRCIRYFLFH